MVQLLESLPASVAGSWKPSVCCYEPRLVDLFLTKKTSDLQKCLKTKLFLAMFLDMNQFKSIWLDKS